MIDEAKYMSNEKIVLVNAHFYGAKGIAPEAQGLGLVIEEGQIKGFLPESEIPQDVQRIDMQGCCVAPGLIDVLVNGAGGGAFGVTARFSDLQQMGAALMHEGTTGFLAAAPSNTLPMYLEMQGQLQAHEAQLPKNFLGMHLEGPYFSMAYRGAHRADCVRDCTEAELEALLDKDRHFVRMMSVSPERITDEQVEYLEQHGIRVSFAHSAASYDEALRFLAKPHHSVTHLFNGMPPMHHRKPGHIPAIFHLKPLTGLIVDGVHVAYPMVRMAYDIMPQSLYLFTDGFTQCPEMGVDYDEGHTCFVRTTPDGSKVLCGSAISMWQAVCHCVKHVEIPLSEALAMASLRPAQLLGIDHLYGSLDAGHMADLLVFDEDLTLKRVMKEGQWQD